MRNIFLLSIVLCAINVYAQDIITLNNGDEIEVSVQKIDETEVAYKRWDFQDGPTFTLKKNEIFRIKYQNGTKDVFNNFSEFVEVQIEQPQVEQTASTPDNLPQQPQQPQQPRHPAESKVKKPKKTSDGGVSIHLGGAFPVGDFGNDNLYADKALGAGEGFNVVLKGKIPLSVKGLGVTVSGDFIFNGYKGDWKDMWDGVQTVIEHAGGTFVRPRYINVPIFVGLNYKYSVGRSFGVWGEAGLGPNFRTMTTAKTEVDNQKVKVVFPVKTSFGFQVGAGIMIKNSVSLGVHYYGLGAAKVKMKEKYSNGKSAMYEYPTKYSHNLVMVRLGYHF